MSRRQAKHDRNPADSGHADAEALVEDLGSQYRDSWYLWYLNYQTVTSLENIQSFDPFAILEVDNDADIRAIKKAYRRKSLVMHPDKNPDDPLAVQEFIKLTKAYAVRSV